MFDTIKFVLSAITGNSASYSAVFTFGLSFIVPLSRL